MTTTTNTSTMDELYKECLTAKPSSGENEFKKDGSFEARRERAVRKAFAEIIFDANDRIRYYAHLSSNFSRAGDETSNNHSESEGRKNARIYTFKKSWNKKYEGIFLLDLLTKECPNGNLLTRLQQHFSPFQCYLKKISTNSTNEDNKYVIFVSWRTDTEGGDHSTHFTSIKEEKQRNF
tara:strand:+ start:578 stop:1114 length:537 start_codon:yes stop_codon:yes gene_type:complete